MKKLLEYLITTLVGAVIVVAVVCAQKIWAQGLTAQMGTLSDAFFAAGVVIGCIGLLVFVSDRGAFDMLRYAVILLVNKFRRDVNKRKYKDFNEYRQMRDTKENKPIAFMLIVGVAYIVGAIVFLIVYYNV